MEDLTLLRDLLIVFAVAGLVVFVFQHLRVPAVVGLLVAGVVVGPYGLSLVGDLERVHVLAEIGVVVLLFTVGLDFSMTRLWGMVRVMLTVGIPQVLLSAVVAAAATGWYLGGFGPAVFAGMLVAMSSTAVVLKILTDRGELSSLHGRIAVAVLLLQDLLVVVFMLVLPLLSEQDSQGEPIWLAFGRGILVLLLVLVAARYAVPSLLFHVVRTRNRELFLISIVVLCLGTAALTAWAGLSLALGAFLAGLAISESEYAHQTLAEVLPFRDTLSSLFFVSVGMLLNLGYVASHLPLVAVTVAAIMVLKFAAVAGPVCLAGYTPRVAVLAGLSLLQIGEFSFVLASRGLELQLLRAGDYQTFLAAAVITMALTPLTMAAGPRLADRLPDRSPAPDRLGRAASEGHDEAVAVQDHVLIGGYGFNGRNVARALKESSIPYLILELNPVTVRALRRQGEPIYFGDCSRPAVLVHVGIRVARVFVVAISDPASTRRAVQAARQVSPQVHIIVRTRYLAEVDELKRLGADEIIPEEFETSIEIFARVLDDYQVPRNVTLDLIERIRAGQYGILRHRRLPTPQTGLPVDVLSQLEVEPCLIRDGSPAIGRSLAELGLRSVTGATIIGVRRGAELLPNPGGAFHFAAGDVGILIGERQQVLKALLVLDPALGRRGTDDPGESRQNDAAGT